MREAKMILDRAPGEPRLRAGLLIEDACAEICREFGGVTTTPSSGCWIDGAGNFVLDNSMIFTVGMEPARWPAFCSLAVRLAVGQETVYAVSPTGQVCILPVPQPRWVRAPGERRLIVQDPIEQEAFACTELGPTPKEEQCVQDRFSLAAAQDCENFVLLAMRRFGEPPRGAYFWTAMGEKGYTMSFCALPSDPAHVDYLHALLGPEMPTRWAA